MRFRLKRQQVLTRGDPLRYEAIIGEAALRQQIGGLTVMRAQLGRLIESPRPDRLSIRVLPFSAGAGLGVSGSFTLFSLRPPGGLTAALVEDFAQTTFFEAETDVTAFDRIYAYYKRAALDESSSLRLIQQIASRTCTP
ncbi:DUF5753 domain-containing protein [Actinoallomurus spadix]|uniref:DUF5753 domain-containing protein n=1 Tax=Actinoallomurus spadix TaxID=79912 RepID=A0ABN0VZ02_9ACTN|nr:DUF5753 domain-containing protein [Actinoallomurus spadix]